MSEQQKPVPHDLYLPQLRFISFFICVIRAVQLLALGVLLLALTLRSGFEPSLKVWIASGDMILPVVALVFWLVCQLHVHLMVREMKQPPLWQSLAKDPGLRWWVRVGLVNYHFQLLTLFLAIGAFVICLDSAGTQWSGLAISGLIAVWIYCDMYRTLLADPPNKYGDQ